MEPAQRVSTVCLILLAQGILSVRWLCVTGGTNSDSPQLSTTECLDPTSGAWELVPSLTLPSASRWITPINLGNVACLAGGDDGSSFTPKRVLCTSAPSLADPTAAPTQVTNDWAVLDTLPSDQQVAVPLYGMGWVGLAGDGWTTTPLPSESLTDPSNNAALTWTLQNGTAPLPYLAFSAVLPLNGKSCLVGGEDVNSLASMTTRCLQGDLSVLTSGSSSGLQWTVGPSLNSARYSHTALQINGEWCVVGGQNDSAQLDNVECLSSTGTFTVMKSYQLPSPLYGATNATIQGMPCVIGGATGSLTSNGVWCVNLSTTPPRWVAGPSLTIPRRYHSSFFLDISESISGTKKPLSAGAIAGISISVLIAMIACLAIFALFRYESRFHHHNVSQPLIQRRAANKVTSRGPPDPRDMALEASLTLIQSTIKGDAPPQSKEGMQTLINTIKDQQRELGELKEHNNKDDGKSSGMVELEVRESESGQQQRKTVREREQGLITQTFEEDQLEFVKSLVHGERHWGSSLYKLTKARESSLATDTEIITKTEVVVRRPQNPENFEAEVKLWRSIGLHPNVARIMGVAKLSDSPGFVMEYYPGGPLQQTSTAERTTEELVKIAIGLARGLGHLHQSNVIHRELALRNILVASDGRVVISDFENSTTRALNENDTYHIATLAPEIIVKPKDGAKREFNEKTDIWALGVVLWELATRRHAYAVELEQFSKLDLLKEKIAHGSVVLDMKPIALEHPALVPALIGCLQRDAQLRPSAQQLGWLLKDSSAGNSIDRNAYITRLQE